MYRTKEFFRENKVSLVIPDVSEIKSRTNAVLSAIYLLFNEGYNSTNAEELIRKDIIEESAILCKLLTENAHTQMPEAFALMALICFHSSRSESRLSAEGEIILLEKQDRSKWNKALISQGTAYLSKAAVGSNMSSYHLEAAIAFEHCVAQSFEKTNWQNILAYYEWLCKIAPSPVAELNKAIVILQLHGAERALKHLEEIENKSKLQLYYLYHCVLGEINCKLNNKNKALGNFETAIQLTQSEAEQKMLKRKIQTISN